MHMRLVLKFLYRLCDEKYYPFEIGFLEKKYAIFDGIESFLMVNPCYINFEGLKVALNLKANQNLRLCGGGGGYLPV